MNKATIERLVRLADKLDHAGKESLADAIDAAVKNAGWGEDKALIAATIAKFPPEFGLRAFPDAKFRISTQDTYISDNKVVLYTEIFKDGKWLGFAKGSPDELLAQIVMPGKEVDTLIKQVEEKPFEPEMRDEYDFSEGEKGKYTEQEPTKEDVDTLWEDDK